MDVFLMFDWDGRLIGVSHDMGHLTSRLHSERAARIETAEGVVLRFFRRGSSLLALVGYGEHAGAPRGTDAAWCAGMN